METEPPDDKAESKKERKFPMLDLNVDLNMTQPILVIQSPKTPTLSRKLKAVSLDSEPQKECLELSRDVFSMPNTPKKQIKSKLLSEYSEDEYKSGLTPCFPTSNLKKFASNTSITGSQTLKTLPEVMTLQDFSDNRVVKSETQTKIMRPKGLLERRGSNASLTIDLGSNSSIAETKVQQPILRLNPARSVSNLNLSTFGTGDKCPCMKNYENGRKSCERRKSQEKCGNCIIYESIPSKVEVCKNKCHIPQKQQRCVCSASKSRRKSLSNENLYVPPCSFCQNESLKDCVNSSRNYKGYNRQAYYPRQPDIEVDQLLSEDFKNHLQNMQYLQTAGSILTVQDLKAACEDSRVPKLHQEFWEVPLNLQEKCYVSGSQNKNRYKGVLPNEHSRVHLPGVQNYIHANFIKGPDYTETAYIATQGPMAHTCQDFWNMIWHTRCQVIVMLTGLVEKGKNKCELYFPLGKRAESSEPTKYFVKTWKTKDKFTFDKINNKQNFQENEQELLLVEYEALDEVNFGNFKIKHLEETEKISDCTLRHLELTKLNIDNKNKEIEGKRIIKHYWFTNWQDHKMADPKMVLDVALNVLESFAEEKDKKPNDEDKKERDNEEGTQQKEKHKRQSSSFSYNRYNYRKGENCTEEERDNQTKIRWSRCKKNSERKKEMEKGRNETDKKRQWTTMDERNWEKEEKEKGESHQTRKTQSNENNAWWNCTENSKNPFSYCEKSGIAEKKSKESEEDVENPFDIRLRRTPRMTKSQRFALGKIENKKKKKENYVELTKETGGVVFPSSYHQQHRRKSSENQKIPLVVHCSAGIGRTGCFLAILNGIQQLKTNGNVDVLAILCSLRLNRGGMVQTAEQYELVHKVLTLFADLL